MIEPTILQGTFTFGPYANGVPLLSIGPDSFKVRGVEVAQGPEEAQQVYDAFKASVLLHGMPTPPKFTPDVLMEHLIDRHT